MIRPTDSYLSSVAVILLLLGFASTAFGQNTIHWKKDYIADANGAPIATATPAPADQIPPSTPSGLTHSSVSFSSATLSWSTSTDTGGSGLAGYKVYRNGVLIGSTTATSLTDTTVEASKTYSFSVVAVDWAGNHSSPSSSDSVTTTSFSGPGTSLTATRVSNSRIDLSWSDNSSGETNFLVERRIGIGGRYSLIATAAPNSTSYQNTGLDDSTVYYYRVRAAAGTTATSAFSNEAYACTCATIASAGTYDGAASEIGYVGTDWDDDSSSYPNAVANTLHYSNVTGHRATFSFDGSSLIWVGNLNSNLGVAAVTIDGLSVANIDLYSTGLTWGQAFTFAVTSGKHTISLGVTGRKNSSASNTYVILDAFTVGNTLSAPTAPGALSATAVSSSQIALQWVDNSTNEAEFKIERKPSGGSYSQLSPTVGANNTRYLDAALLANATYIYRIRASNAAGDSSYSDEASATTPDNSPPSTPTGLSATTTSITTGTASVSLSWNGSSDNVAVDHYELQRRGSGNYSVIGTPSSAIYTDSASAGDAYLYRVRAVDAAGNTSNWSNVDLATTIVFAETLTQYSTQVKASHFTELRTAVNYVRTLAGLSNATYTHSSLSAGNVIYAVDLQELRTKLGEARDALGLTTAAYSESISSGSTTIKKSHIDELRENIK